MFRRLTYLATSVGAVASIGALLVRGSVQTQRVGPGPTHPDARRVYNPAHGRRSFLRWAMLGAVAVSLAQFGLVFVRFFWPNKTDAFGGEILAGSLGSMPAVGADPLRHNAGRFYVIRNEEGLMAFYWKCTHLGCTVPWSKAEGKFHCPCHGSEFDRKGLVVGGPAPRPMDVMEIKIQGDNVIVNTGKIRERADYDAAKDVTTI